MLSLVAAALLAQAAPSFTVAAPLFRAPGLDEAKVAHFTDYFAQKVSRTGGFAVVTASQIQQQLSLQRQRALLGCEDGALGEECMVEIAGALGADVLVSGTITPLDDGHALHVRALRPKTNQELFAAAGEAYSDEELVAWLNLQAQRMGPAVRRAMEPEAELPQVATTPRTLYPLRRRAWIPAAIGGAALAGAGALQYLAFVEHRRIVDAEDGSLVGPADAERAAARGASYQTAAASLGVAALAAGASAAALALWPREVLLVQHGVFAGPGGAHVSIGGEF